MGHTGPVTATAVASQGGCPALCGRHRGDDTLPAGPHSSAEDMMINPQHGLFHRL